MRIILLIFLFLVSPFFVSANVIISEVAWMGSDNGGTSRQNANDEWLELYNDSPSAADIGGWIMEIVGSKQIALSGEIAPGGYYLIERTNDDSAPGAAADLISSFGRSGLKNGGSILILRDGNGNELQKINAQDGWPAGDNSSKETMQWGGSSWITAPPTPGAPNIGVSQAGETEQEPAQSEARSEVEEEPMAESAAADEEEISGQEINSPAGGEETPALEKHKIAVEPEIQPAETLREVAETKSSSRRQENKRQKEEKSPAERRERATVYLPVGNGQKGLQEDDSLNAQSVQKEEKKNPPAAVAAAGAAEQSANVITAVSGKVREAEDWLVLVLIIGILAGIGTLFIRG